MSCRGGWAGAVVGWWAGGLVGWWAGAVLRVHCGSLGLPWGPWEQHKGHTLGPELGFYRLFVNSGTPF